jgi:Zn-dependent peptidase ImmA (M78 family)/transcriptional regulator with XRE-family HTH domain
MSINAAQLGERLRTAREKRGLSQQTVAEILGLSRTAVTNMEMGNRAVSSLELTQLAQEYGRSITYFLLEQAEEEDLSTILLRVLPEFMNEDSNRQAIEDVLDLYREGFNLRSLLGQEQESALPTFNWPVHTAGDAVAQGQRAAVQERLRLGLGSMPIGDMAELIATQGIWTAAATLPDWLSGMFLNHPSIGLAVLINSEHRLLRKRFSYAHEYAHALLDRSLTVQPTRNDNNTELVEKRANAFAAAFLMPADGIAEQLYRLRKGNPSRWSQVVFDAATEGKIEAEIRPRPGSQAITYQDVAIIARHFLVSYDAAAWRLRSLNHVSASECSALIDHRDIGRRYMTTLLGVHDEEPGNDRELRYQLANLAIEAYRQGEISKGRLREIARKLPGITTEDLLELAEAACAD